ncbi:FlgN protein [Propionispira arboris]|uniref:FlgN protein n=1 Tax=Propionispira arboris TaxID=84035 RepID=A0A1H7CF12_9FIRM|nr:flagellar export chaperone FlgN [Propionispira arboris]SEJ88218.1 FlgN protein [Propionispira arboris]
MTELIIMLKAQITLGQQLLSFGDLQKQYLLAGDAKNSADVTMKTEQIINKFSLLERKKQKLLQDHSENTINVNQNSMMSEDTVSQLEQRLRMIVLELKEKNAKNSSLLHKTIEFINFNINIISQTVADTTYAPKGTSGAAVCKKKMFDQII